MSKIVSTKKINAGFLAIVLIAGTLAAVSPSFMIGVHAQQYGMDQKYNTYEQDYGMDNGYDDNQSYGKDSNSYDKSKDSSNVILKKVKCNNINANLNGFNGVDINALPTALRGLAIEVQASEDEGEIGASFFGSDGGRPSGSDTDSRICINNNDFNVNERGTTPEPTCEECFTKNLNEAQLDAVADYLSGTTFEDLEGLCEFLSDPTNPNTEKLRAITDLFTVVIIPIDPTFNNILKCLEDLGLIIVPSGGDNPGPP